MSGTEAQLAALAGHVQAGRQGEAVQLAERLIAAGVDHPLPLWIGALERRRSGRVEEAVALLERRALAMGTDPEGWAALAGLLGEVGRPQPALAAWSCALERAPGDPRLMWRKALAFEAAGQASDARDLLRQALKLAPGVFELRFDLARLALQTGDQAQAQGLCADLLREHPQSPAVGWLAARIAANAQDWDAAVSHVAMALAQPGLGPEQRAELRLLEAEARDGLGDPARAFAAAVEGKALQRAVYAARAREHEGEVERLRRLARFFRAAEPADWGAAPGGDTEGPATTHVFLVGFPRSGTTLLEQVLAGHPQVTALEEAPTFAPHYAALMADEAGLRRLASLSADEARSWRARYWDEVRAAGADPTGRVFLDKAPAGALHLPLVQRLFPHALVLFALRDPRDVTLSCFRHNFQLNASTYAFTDLAETAACYDATMGLAEIYRRLPPLAWRDVRHEALVEDFDGELAEICGFLGIEPDPRMRDIAATAAARPVRTPSAPQVRAGLNRRGLGRWRAYAEQLAPVLPVLAPWVERFGYEA